MVYISSTTAFGTLPGRAEVIFVVPRSTLEGSPALLLDSPTVCDLFPGVPWGSLGWPPPSHSRHIAQNETVIERVQE